MAREGWLESLQRRHRLKTKSLGYCPNINFHSQCFWKWTPSPSFSTTSNATRQNMVLREIFHLSERVQIKVFSLGVDHRANTLQVTSSLERENVKPRPPSDTGQRSLIQDWKGTCGIATCYGIVNKFSEPMQFFELSLHSGQGRRFIEVFHFEEQLTMLSTELNFLS